jgi:asparagine synthase (glutamine-hydrolysing)
MPSGICGSLGEDLEGILPRLRHRNSGEWKRLGDTMAGSWADGDSVYDVSFDGYAFALRKNDGEIFVGRDALGLKSLWVSGSGFATEGKVLPGEKRMVLPGEMVRLSSSGKVESVSLQRIEKKPEPVKEDYESLKREIVKAVEERKAKKNALLFSGGVDSTLLAVLLGNPVCYCAGVEGSQDIAWAGKVAKELGLDLRTRVLEEDEIQGLVPGVVETIETDDFVKLSIALPFYAACGICKEEKVIFSGLGTEELFAGYQRHREAFEKGGYRALHDEMWKGLEGMWERDLYRDDCLTAKHGLDLRLPFLDFGVVREAMSIKPEMKLRKSERLNKLVLRDIARELGVPKEVCERPKKAVQYGSGIAKVLKACR